VATDASVESIGARSTVATDASVESIGARSIVATADHAPILYTDASEIHSGPRSDTLH
jgi:hypothetical protein